MAKEIDMKELNDLVMETVAEVEKDLEKVKAKEVKPDKYADTLEKPVSWEEKLGINPTTSGKKMLDNLKLKEHKALRLINALRKQRAAIMKEMKEEKLKKENARLRAAIKKIKHSK